VLAETRRLGTLLGIQAFLAVGLWLAGAAAAGAEPVWIGAPLTLPPGEETVFTHHFELPQAPRQALLRLVAYDRYRLTINGKPVSVGDTPWDAETYAVTALLTAGANTLTVSAHADSARPANCWLWLRRTLPAPGSFTRLSFTTRGARADEWVYVEVVDAQGKSSGLYCLEMKRPDFMLGHDGAEVVHTIELATEATLVQRPEPGGGSGCDFAHIAAVGIRMDRKNALDTPAGRVEFAAIRLHGATELDLSDVGDWRLEPGVGECRRSQLEPASDGYFALRYDFTPANEVRLALDLRAWGAAGEMARVTSGPDWQAGGGPVRLAEAPLDPFAWTRLALTGPAELARPPLLAGVRLDFGTEYGRAGQAQPVRVNVWAAPAMPGVRVQVTAENWAGTEVLRQDLPVEWAGANGHAEFATPALPRGLYRFTTVLPGVPAQERHAALAVLAPGESRVSAIFDTLSPIAQGGPLRGIDCSWSGSPAQMLSIRDQGVNFIQVHLDAPQLDHGEYAELLAFCKVTGVHVAFNNEHANWAASSPDPAGRNRFDAPGGCHRWDLEPAALDAAVATGLFEGVVYDEGEHMQLCRNRFANLPDAEHRQPYLVETTGLTLPAAYEAFLGAAQQVRTYHRDHGARMLVESVFPALWHPLARAGVTLCPKLLKESIYPAVLALALGAAQQYQAELWFSPDLWLADRFPGHSLQEYAAALRLAHAAGVDNVYTEFGSALCRVRGATYELTDYGVALRDFIREYVPAHPRAYDYRDYEPEVAIIRFPDSDWGQASCYYWKTLYGAENLPPTSETGEWLQVISLLTAGKTNPGAVNTNSGVYPRYDWPGMIPAPPTAVYDHLAGPEMLRTASTLFLCGIMVSEATLAAVQERVAQGAVCFAPKRLCPAAVREQAEALPARITAGRGAWIVVPGFRPEDLGPYASLIPAAGTTMRLRFKGQTVSVGE
jgi:hypothetical protein